MCRRRIPERRTFCSSHLILWTSFRRALGDGIRDVSNVDRMGKDEVQLVNEMIQGVMDLVKWEKDLALEAWTFGVGASAV